MYMKSSQVESIYSMLNDSKRELWPRTTSQKILYKVELLSSLPCGQRMEESAVVQNLTVERKGKEDDL